MGKSYTDALDIYEIQSVVIETESNKLKASEDKEIISVNSIEVLVKEIASGKIKYKEIKKDVWCYYR